MQALLCPNRWSLLWDRNCVPTPFFFKIVKFGGFIVSSFWYIASVLLIFDFVVIIIPYESLFRSFPEMIFLTLCSIWIQFVVHFHYHRTRYSCPLPPGDVTDRRCLKCQSFKGKRTSHCGVCNRCIVGLDHHCPWVNNCVGAHNHAHFFMFLVYLFIGMVFHLYFAFNTFTTQLWNTYGETYYCNTYLPHAWLKDWTCRNLNPTLLLMILCGLTCVTPVAMITYISWNVFLISRGHTLISWLKAFRDRAPPRPETITENWREFFALSRCRPLYYVLLWPSSFPRKTFVGSLDSVASYKYSL
ncbi:unnamed protein product [Caenorhabditis auriculariae]|uniref:Palmitoyltransferase n=1 Tax=Caenorhabditis auriculariae TaxID=2777116 RepID=A0A8S1GS15_9PELO|nr:unnamed protein product [Caenorhabditis auriculariae]